MLARVRAANEQAARAGVGGRRVVLRLLALPATAALTAVFIWGVDALGWIFLAFMLGTLATICWSVRHAGTRWLLPLVPLLMIWPVIERWRRGGGPIDEALSVTLLLAAMLAINHVWRRQPHDARTWRALAILATTPLWWVMAITAHTAVQRFMLTGYFDGEHRARFGLPFDETSFALGLTAFALIAAYWVLLGLVIARVANRYRTPPSEDDETPEAIWL